MVVHSKTEILKFRVFCIGEVRSVVLHFDVARQVTPQFVKSTQVGLNLWPVGSGAGGIFKGLLANHSVFWIVILASMVDPIRPIHEWDKVWESCADIVFSLIVCRLSYAANWSVVMGILNVDLGGAGHRILWMGEGISRLSWMFDWILVLGTIAGSNGNWGQRRPETRGWLGHNLGCMSNQKESSQNVLTFDRKCVSDWMELRDMERQMEKWYV
jgi:hypothetical protein